MEHAIRLVEIDPINAKEIWLEKMVFVSLAKELQIIPIVESIDSINKDGK